MGGYRLLYFAKSKNGTKYKNLAVLLCFYVNALIHYFVFAEMAGRGGATTPIATPLNPPLKLILFLEVALLWSLH